jgi:hypothetical protein
MEYRWLFPLIAILALLAAPVMAGEQQLFGSPKLSAAISGTNEFTPGEDVTLTIQNPWMDMSTGKMVKDTTLITIVKQ